MKTSLKWLKDYAPCQAGCDDVVERMIAIGNEVEGVEDPGKDITGVVTGRITQITKHPDADRLQVCQLDVGGQTLQIVTGAQNVFVGAVVPVATHGAHLAGGIKIKKSKLRGVESSGMLCSGQELGITDGHYPGASVDGILILDADTPVGQDIRPIVGIDSPVLEFKPLANRPDCMSVLGLAGEVSAAYRTPLQMPPCEVAEGGGDIREEITVSVEAPERCTRYMARVVKGVTIAPSPAWMRHRLLSAGIRPINNIVDVTNFIMLEMGQPLHAFDLRYIADKKIIVRTARPGETITLLDEKDYTLDDNMLVIADGQKPRALAGIMGGMASGIMEDTRDVLIEAAVFTSVGTRQTSRQLGVRSESSARYEKGVDAATTPLACDRAARLMAELGGGTVVSGHIDVCAHQPGAARIVADPARINALLGVTLDTAEMVELLNALHLDTHAQDGMLHVTVPYARRDIAGEADLAEEIMRLHGYDDIPAARMAGPILVGGYSDRRKKLDAVSEYLVACGLYGAMNYSFTGPRQFALTGQDAGQALKLRNPLGEDLSLMRRDLAAGLIGNLALNAAHKNPRARLFEIGKVFMPQGEELPREDWHLGLAAFGGVDFYAVKAWMDGVVRTLGVEGLAYEPGGPQWLHPGRSARVLIDGAEVGFVGELHPDVAEAQGIRERAYVAEINLEAMLDAKQTPVTYRPMPKFPAVSRDLALVMAADQPVGPVMEAIRQAAGSRLETLNVFDVYRGLPLGPDEKSVAFSLSWRDAQKTLTDADIAPMVDDILQACAQRFGARLRA
nr:phenylalanine--tRNA ligase subunit beta [bacterium]